MFQQNLAQSEMQSHSIEAWLLYDFRGSNPVMWQVLGNRKSTTRRSFLVIPKEGDAYIIAHTVDKEQFADFDFPIKFYTTWSELHQHLEEVVQTYNRIAMEYSPKAAIPTLSWVDVGTFELLESFGAEIVSSADLYQVALASWSSKAFDSHIKVNEDVANIKDLAFDYIRRKAISKTGLTEYDVQNLILDEFKKRKLETEDNPIVAVNENSGDPHYEPSSELHSPIKLGDWVLIDLWARHPGDQNVFGDITWVAYVGKDVPPKYQQVFDIVRAARDAVVKRLTQAWQKGDNLKGWELDVIAREHISKAGYGKDFVHRTGHSIGPGSTLHALGVNIDNFETKDIRTILPKVGFSVEPGIYLKEFGVRLEINVYIDPSRGPIVTTPIQNEIITLA